MHERLDDLPKTVGVRPTQNPPEAEVNPDFSLTVPGKVAAAAGAAATVGLLALPVTWVAGAAGVGAAGAGGLLTLAIVQYLTTVLTIDWFGVGLGSRQVKQSLNDRPEGTSLPPIGIPVDVDFNRQRLAVYFRPLPAKLWIGSVDGRRRGQPTSPRFGWSAAAGPPMAMPWKLSNDDAMLYADSGELQLFMEPDSVSGDGPADQRRHRRQRSSLPAGGERGSRQTAAASAVVWSRQRDSRKVSSHVERTHIASLACSAVAGQRRARPNRPL